MSNQPDPLERVRKEIEAGNFEVSKHARERMQERNIRIADIQRAAEMAHDLIPKGEFEVEIIGPDLDDVDFTFVADFRNEVLIITVFDQRD